MMSQFLFLGKLFLYGTKYIYPQKYWMKCKFPQTYPPIHSHISGQQCPECGPATQVGSLYLFGIPSV